MFMASCDVQIVDYHVYYMGMFIILGCAVDCQSLGCNVFVSWDVCVWAWHDEG